MELQDLTIKSWPYILAAWQSRPIQPRASRESVTALIAVCVLGLVQLRAANAQDETQSRNLFIQAYELRQAGNNQAAFRLYLKSAELGYLDAQFQAGFHYEFGEGVEKNLAEAIGTRASRVACMWRTFSGSSNE